MIKKIDYRKVERIAAAFEAELGLAADDDLAEKIDERTRKEQQKADVPKPCLPASDKDDEVKMVAADDEAKEVAEEADKVAEEIERQEALEEINAAEDEIDQSAAPAPEEASKAETASRKASLVRLLKMARTVKANKKLTASQRANALEKIRKVAKRVVVK